jgi:ABC-type glycerol-3-phosphate transport system substrate-binding protein
MKTKIRLLSALLLAALLTSFIITSCGADSEKSGETTAPDATAAAETTEAETEPPYEFLKNPEDFGGRTFTVLTGNAEPIDLDDSIKRGDVIIEAIHERNLNTEELLNVKIRSVKSEIDVIKKMSEAVLANTGDYDAAFPSIWHAALALPNHYMVDFREVESIDLENPWWGKTTIETFDFDSGKTYMIDGEINYMDDLSIICLYFNKDLLINVGLELPYNKVRDGSWTFDAFREIEKDGYFDLNGNGEADENDRYGYVTNGSNAFNMVTGMGSLTTRKNSDGDVEFVLDEAYFSKFDLVIDVLSNSPSTVIMERKFGYGLGNEIFGFGNTYFAYNLIGSCLSYRSLEFDIGVVPFPKYDENQDRYYCLVNTGYATVYVLPLGCDAEFSGAVLEAMGYFASLGLTEAAIDQSVLIKGVRDEDSFDMFKIVFESKVHDLIYTLDWGGYYGKTCGIVESGKNKLASTYASIKKSVDKDLEKYIEAIRTGAAG